MLGKIYGCKWYQYLIYLYIFENAFATHVNSIIGDAGEEKQYQIDQIGQIFGDAFAVGFI